jgi:hypothetical protein
MKTFNVLPTNEDFRNLSDSQIDLIIYSLQEDHREAELARKGLSAESDYYDTSFDEEIWTKEVGDWEVLKEGHEANSIAKQVEKLTKEEDLKNLYSKFDSLDDYNKYLEEGGKTARETEVEQYINKQIQAAEEKAKAMDVHKGKRKLVDDRDRPEVSDNSDKGMNDLNKEAMDKAIQLFNDKNDDDEYTKL